VSNSSVVSFRSELESVRARLRESLLNGVREILKDRDILAACREVGHSFRNRLQPVNHAETSLIAAFFTGAGNHGNIGHPPVRS
jgi:hypothetical protein